MRVLLKKGLAIIISVVMVLLIVPINVVRATIPVNVIPDTITRTITDKSTSVNFWIEKGGTLIIAETGIVTRDISISEGGTLIVNGSCMPDDSDDPVYPDEAGPIGNGGTIINNGYIYEVSQTGGTIENSGTITAIYGKSYISGGSIENKAAANIDSLEMGNLGTLMNYGEINTLSLPYLQCTLQLKSGSRINNFKCTASEVDSVPVVSLSSEDGAVINNAEINADYFSSGSGTLNISDSFSVTGQNPFPSGLTIVVNSGTIINKDSTFDGWSVNCGGISYALPAVTFSGKTISDIYNMEISDPSDKIWELFAGYGTEDITSETFTISNTGLGKMMCKITYIPDFVELYDSTGKKLTTDSIIALSAGSEEEVTIKPKLGMSVALRAADLTLEKWTDEADNDADDVLVETQNIPVTVNVIRKKGSGTVSVADIYYGETINPIVTSATNGINNVTYEYKKKDAADDTYTTDVPTEIGEYTVRATFEWTDEYSEVKATDDFEIRKKKGTGTVSVADIYYGETVNPVVTSTTNGINNVTYEYKKKDASDDTYTTEVPTKAGEYTARATFGMTDEYSEVKATDDFAILRKTGAGTVSVADIYYGETVNPVVTSTTNGIGNVTYEYKRKNASDDAYTTEAPTKAGEYTIRATFGMTDEYMEIKATDDFAILRKTGVGTITVPHIYYGTTINPVVTSTTNGTQNVSIEYKKKDEADSAYTTVIPDKVGEYTARATFAMTDEYLEVKALADFVIAYLDTPENAYSIRGTRGVGDYYTSVVTITPADGYMIADSLDGMYKQELVISETKDSFMIYLKKTETGEKTTGILVSDIKIDRDAPEILGTVPGEVMYGEQVEITIQDENLVKVLVNDEEMEIKDHKVVLRLSSNLGEEEYEIICIDVAGNMIKTKVVVAADWMKERMIPSGSKVRLSNKYSYQLGSGMWSVEGDGTTYTGNSTFYVTSDGEYSFTKVD